MRCCSTILLKGIKGPERSRPARACDSADSASSGLALGSCARLVFWGCWKRRRLLAVRESWLRRRLHVSGQGKHNHALALALNKLG